MSQIQGSVEFKMPTTIYDLANEIHSQISAISSKVDFISSKNNFLSGQNAVPQNEEGAKKSERVGVIGGLQDAVDRLEYLNDKFTKENIILEGFLG